MGDIVLKTSVGFWTLKDVRVVPSLMKSLIFVRQFDEHGHDVKFENQQWKFAVYGRIIVRGSDRPNSEDKQSLIHRI